MGIEIKNLVMEYKKGIKSLNNINLCELCEPTLEDAYIYSLYVKDDKKIY